MRKIKIIFLVTIVSVFSGCNKDVLLSCDETIDQWAKENLAYYENAERSEIVELPLRKQQALYVGFSAEKKIQLWHEKLDIIINEMLLEHDELMVYKKLIDYVKPYHFNISKGREELQEFGEKIEKELRERFSWNDEKVVLFTHTWLLKNELELAVIAEKTLHVKSGDELIGIGGPSKPGEEPCNCHYSIFCQTSGLGTVCQAKSCKVTMGCGVMGNSSCDGYCE